MKKRRNESAVRGHFSTPEKRLKWLLSVLLLTIFVGTMGYHLIEGGNLLDDLYMTVITVATVGFTEVFPLSPPGKIFTMILITFSVVLIGYTVGTLGQFLVEGELRAILGRRKMEKKIREMKDHYIVVGYGRVGQMVYAELCRQSVPSVVIESDPEILPALEKACTLIVPASANEDETLIGAGIQHAKALINTIPNEADAVYITLTARQLNPKLYIIARADSKPMERKLRRAGADRVVLPYEIGGKRMAMASLRPNVVDFMTIESLSGQLGMTIEEVEVFEGSKVAGHSLRDSDLRSKHGLTVVGIKKPTGDLVLHPSGETMIEKGDILILMGKTEALEKLGSNG